MQERFISDMRILLCGLTINGMQAVPDDAGCLQFHDAVVNSDFSILDDTRQVCSEPSEP